MFLGLRERPGLEGAGCGEPHIWSVAYAARERKRGRRKKLEGGDAGELMGWGATELAEPGTNLLRLDREVELYGALKRSGEQGEGLRAVLGLAGE